MVDRVIQVINHEFNEEEKNAISGPMALRFVRPSKVYLAPNYEYYKGKKVVEWCYLEILRVKAFDKDDNDIEKKVFRALQKEMEQLGGRPHWGLNFDGIDFNPDYLKQLYPHFDKWYRSYKIFNKDGTFDSVFTDLWKNYVPR